MQNAFRGLPPLLKTLAALVLVGLLLSLGLPLVLVAQDSTLVEVVPEIPGSLAELLTQYQLVLATLVGSAIVYGLASVTAFSRLGDWPKRLAYLVAAILVSAVVKWAGGTMSADLAGVISTGLSGLASAVTGMGVFQMAKHQPGNK